MTGTNSKPVRKTNTATPPQEKNQTIPISPNTPCASVQIDCFAVQMIWPWILDVARSGTTRSMAIKGVMDLIYRSPRFAQASQRPTPLQS
jgi:hypothetical protein